MIISSLLLFNHSLVKRTDCLFPVKKRELLHSLLFNFFTNFVWKDFFWYIATILFVHQIEWSEFHNSMYIISQSSDITISHPLFYHISTTFFYRNEWRPIKKIVSLQIDFLLRLDCSHRGLLTEERAGGILKWSVLSTLLLQLFEDETCLAVYDH